MHVLSLVLTVCRSRYSKAVPGLSAVFAERQRRKRSEVDARDSDRHEASDSQGDRSDDNEDDSDDDGDDSGSDDSDDGEQRCLPPVPLMNAKVTRKRVTKEEEESVVSFFPSSFNHRSSMDCS